MRLLATADLHYNHPKSRRMADELIDRMNREGGDALLVIGDTSVADGDLLEQCLERFRFAGPKLITAGNHELWTHRDDSYAIYMRELPARVAAMGWSWLESEPFVAGSAAIVGSIGWYDYSFAAQYLKIPRRFYEGKVTPAAAEHFEECRGLLAGEAAPPEARDVYARWNDGRFVKLHRNDEGFLGELLDRLRNQLESLSRVPHILAAIHHLPFAQLLPPLRIPQWDFAREFLGSDRIGRLLLEYPNVRHVLCGHSHLPAEAQIGPIRAVNIGSGYRWKTHVAVELPE